MAKRNTLKSIPIYREDQNKCMSWCLNNGIKTYITLGEAEELSKYSFGEYVNGQRIKRSVSSLKIIDPYEKGLVRVVVDNNGAITKSPELYTQEEANMKIWQIYCHFYDTNK